MNETATIYAKAMIESLMSVYALANMHRASGDEGYREAAEQWLPVLEGQLASLRAALTRKDSR